VRKVEEAVQALKLNIDDANTKERRPNVLKQELRSLQFKLSSYFGAKVSIKTDDKQKGEIKIPFTSQEELDKILHVLKFES
jgi:ParB family chromosome partitioning protein